MKQEEKIKALKEAIKEANTKETYGLYKIKNIVLGSIDLDIGLLEALDLLEAGFNLKNYSLNRRQKKLLEAYNIDTEAGKTISKENIDKIIEERK